MAKPDNPAEAPVSVRPPRPVQRVRLDASAEGNAPIDGRARSVSFDAHSLDEPYVAERDVAERDVAERDVAEPCGIGGRMPRGLSDDGFDTTRNLEPPHLEASGAFLADGSLADDAFEVEGASFETEQRAEPAFAADDGLYDDAPGPDDGSGLYHQPSLYAQAEQDDDDPGYDDLGYASSGYAGSPGQGADDAYAEDATRLTPSRAAVAPRIASADPRPGLAWARRPGSAAAEPVDGSTAGPSSRVPKFPVANLEPPSASRLELTPSPVPRVALAPATGAVDISLVPGPRTVGSRNLPTLAAQHLVGRRAPQHHRHHAPAVTVPPPAAREARAAFTLARDVRSSKGEIVLGLTIGLGVSLLLAGLGQTYLRSDPIADAPSAPAQLESVTLSARPELAAPSAEAVAAARDNVAESAPGSSGAEAPASSGERSTPLRSRDAVAASGDDADESALLARSGSAKHSGRTPQHATPARATRGRRSQAAAGSSTPGGHGALDSRGAALSPAAVSPAAVSPAAVSPAGPFAPPSEPPAASAPLTPAESAGLGLDLPL